MNNIKLLRSTVKEWQGVLGENDEFLNKLLNDIENNYFNDINIILKLEKLKELNLIDKYWFFFKTSFLGDVLFNFILKDFVFIKSYNDINYNLVKNNKLKKEFSKFINYSDILSNNIAGSTIIEIIINQTLNDKENLEFEKDNFNDYYNNIYLFESKNNISILEKDFIKNSLLCYTGIWSEAKKDDSEWILSLTNNILITSQEKFDLDLNKWYEVNCMWQICNIIRGVCNGKSFYDEVNTEEEIKYDYNLKDIIYDNINSFTSKGKFLNIINFMEGFIKKQNFKNKITFNKNSNVIDIYSNIVCDVMKDLLQNNRDLYKIVEKQEIINNLKKQKLKIIENFKKFLFKENYKSFDNYIEDVKDYYLYLQKPIKPDYMFEKTNESIWLTPINFKNEYRIYINDCKKIDIDLGLHNYYLSKDINEIDMIFSIFRNLSENNIDDDLFLDYLKCYKNLASHEKEIRDNGIQIEILILNIFESFNKKDIINKLTTGREAEFIDIYKNNKIKFF
jgi:hypothetical protein